MYTIWGRPDCIRCERAKKFLEDVGEDYNYITLDTSNSLEFFEKTKGRKTVPQVFDPSGGHIGGYEALIEYYQNIVTADVHLA